MTGCHRLRRREVTPPSPGPKNVRAELTLNVLLTEPAALEAMHKVLAAVVAAAPQSEFRDAGQQLLRAEDKAVFALLSLFNTFLE